MKLSRSYYLHGDVVCLARDLLGKTLYTRIDGNLTGGIITETEAYRGIGDRASHAWNGSRTARNEVMYAAGGVAYVFLCYGVHYLFNVVTNNRNIPDAILIRGLIPTTGEKIMADRWGKEIKPGEAIYGPGRVSRLLSILPGHNGISLTGDTIWIEQGRTDNRKMSIKASSRIGVDYAGEDANLPYRFTCIPG
ncbi:MAG: DNA-3-methyladenine glycosylase [Bacteroidales bacterium]|nr:DNA-3-methyladenine glycosylase [Bacteroidales bacterium]